MKKLKSKYLVALLMIMILPISLLLVNAEDTKGKIEISKTATKIYDTVDENNLVYGRKAKITLDVNANPYSVDSFSTLDIVLIIDESGSMEDCAKYDRRNRCEISRIGAAKNAASSFVDKMIINNKTNVRIGIVSFSSKTNDILDPTYNKTDLNNFIEDNLSPNGGTNIDDAIDSANNMIKSSTADKKMVILLSDGIPTYFMYNGKIFGNGEKDIEVAYTCSNPKSSWNLADQYTYSCRDGNRTKPSTEANNAANTLKNGNTNLTFYTIGFGITSNSDAEKVLMKLPTSEDNYLQALDADALYNAFVKITEEAVEKIATNTTVVDTIPATFTLSNEEKARLESLGVIVTNNTDDGTTTLTWTIGDLYANDPKTLTYEVIAKDDFHGSMYTNESAIITATVEEDNPYYDGTSVNEKFTKPAVDIPAITNDDHYNNNEYESYTSYEGTNVIATVSILKNDINKNILTDNQMVVNDKINIITNENTIKNTDGTYTIKDKGILTVNNDGTFTFVPNDNYTGEVSFDYQILTEITSGNETNYVISNTSTVTMLIKPRATTQISGTKIWNDEDNKYNNRPNKITLTLIGTANGNEVVNETIEVSAPWNYEFNNLYKYVIGHENDNNYLINYVVREQAVTGYDTTYNDTNITNSLITTSISGTKTWNDNKNQDGKRPTEIIVNLLANGEKVSETTTDASKNWKYEFTNLPVYKNGNKVTYTVTENKVNDYTTTINGFDITNTHEIEKTSVTVNKVWNDSDNQDGKRYEVIAELYKNGTATGITVRLNENNNYSATISDLDKYENGNVINYTFVETNVENGYSVSYSDNGLTITNTRTPEVTSINGTKTWDDNNNQDGKRPTEIIVNLYANGAKVSETTTDASKNWKYEFTNLPVYKNGNKVTYTVTENKVNDYTTTINGFDITNTHEIEKTSVTVNKVWNDSDNQDGMRYEVIAELYKNGTATGTTVRLNENNNYTATINDLDKYENGNVINYTFVETNVENRYSVSYSDNGLTIVNTREVEKTSATVNKVWNDSDNQDGMRYEVIAELYKNGTATGTTVRLNENNNYTATINDLDKYENGNVINYTFVETNVENGYSVSYSDTGLTITNTRTPEVTSINGTKTWDDNNNQDGKRPTEIIVNLYANGAKVSETTTDASKNWKYEFTNLPVYKNGNKITYTVNENDVPGYTTTVNGFDITNKYTPEKTSVTVNKVWNDSDNQDGKRYEVIALLYKNGVATNITVKLNSDNGYTATISGLDKYENGNVINYTFVETNVENDYSVSYSEDGLTITNTREVEKTSVTVNKIWNDNDNQDGMRYEVIAELYKNGVATGIIVTLNEDNRYSATINDLDKYENGNVINYTFVETNVENGYSVNYTDDGLTIINSKEVEKVNVTVNKQWIDANNQDGKRYEVIAELYKNGVATGITVKLNTDNDYTATISNLDKYEKGNIIKYTFVETNVENDYSVSYSEDGLTIVNTREVEKINIPVNKVWDDADNQDGIRTEKVTINLIGMVGEKEVFSTTLTLSEENNWSSVFENLNKYYEGKIINYIVSEDNVLGYSTTIIKDENGFTITNTHTPEVISVSGNKNWDDAGNQDGMRPESIEITLIGTVNDEIVYTEVKNVSENDNWSWTFTNAPKYNNGIEISYSIKETSVSGYETIYDEDNYNVTNSYVPETISIKVIKNWNDYENNDRIRPDSITVKLLTDGVITYEITISESDNWTYEFTNLPKYKNQGTLINYSIIEDEVIGYETNIGKITEVANDNNFKNTNYLVEITNTHEKEQLDIEGNKTWIDNDNEANMRPENIIIDLYADDVIIDTVSVSEEDKWKYFFRNLDKYKDGIEIKYSIKEHMVKNYTTKYDGYDVINLFGGTGNIEEPPKTGVEKTNNYNLFPIIYMLMLLLFRKVIVK